MIFCTFDGDGLNHPRVTTCQQHLSRFSPNKSFILRWNLIGTVPGFKWISWAQFFARPNLPSLQFNNCGNTLFSSRIGCVYYLSDRKYPIAQRLIAGNSTTKFDGNKPCKVSAKINPHENISLSTLQVTRF